MRRVFSFDSTLYPELKSQILFQSKEYQYFQFLDSNDHEEKYSQFDWMAAIGAKEIIEPLENEFEALYSFHQTQKDWLFGHFSYDLKNSLEDLQSNNADPLQFKSLSFFVPQTVVHCKGKIVTVESFEYENEEGFISALSYYSELEEHSFIELKAQTSKEEYLNIISELKKHLQFGNIYEINFCMEYAHRFELEPLSVFQKLQDLSKAPFAAYYRSKDQYLICASPERYLQRKGNKVISQPIKGTSKRSSNPEEDQGLKRKLYNDEKERSENVMIVDLVRNDLSRTSTKGSVKVEELFGIYSYRGVHQMMSTIQSEIDPKSTAFTEVIKHSFPMGSMTGAPKIRAMKLIEEFENFSRSLYSGSVGYISPEGDFDFNVVIRSILYNANSHYVSARVGSAITIHCDAEKEYDECLLKAQNLFKALRSDKTVEV